ncbi:MAG: ABC transporter substrate-binding protein, partial [Candidatus Rokuibacteriota bacterium]
KIHIDRVEFVPILDSTARLASLRSGDLTMMERVPPTDLAQIRADAKLKVVGVAELGYQTIPLNIANGPKAKAFADFRVRQALDLAIDREALIKAVFNNEYIPGNQWVAPSNPYYNKAFPVKTRDVARARQLLREAGHAQLAFTLIVPPERDRQEAALLIQSMLAEAGMTMTIQTQENVTMLTAGRKGDFEAYFTFWSGRPDPDGNVFSFNSCSGAQNDGKYCNPDVDGLLQKARHVFDPAERKKLYDQVTAILMRDVPRLHLWHRRVFTGFSARLQGFTPHPDGIIRVRGLRQ